MKKDILQFGTPEEAGISSRNVVKFIEDIKKKRTMMHSFIFIRNGKVFAEGYYPPFVQDEFHRMYSVSKTFVSMAVGALIGEGKLSLDDKVVSFFPDKCPGYVHPWVADATVRDLLRMATPFREGTTYKVSDPDWSYTFFNTEPNHPAGTIFNYDTSGSYILDVIVERITGKPFMEYLKEKALKAIGFSEGSFCVKAPEGYSWGGSGVMCSTRDLARLALLVANDGVFEGRELLPADYLKEARSFQIDNNTSGNNNLYSGLGYGYQIWRTYDNGYSFVGMGGQLAITIPEKNFIAVFTGDSQGHSVPYGGVFEALRDNITDHLGDAMPADDAALSEMKEAIANLTPAMLAGKESSPAAKEISGVTYRMNREDRMGIRKLTLNLGEDEGELVYDTTRGLKTLRFGFGKFVVGTFPETHYFGDTIGTPSGKGYRYMAQAVWTEERKLVLRVYLIDMYFGNFTATFAFKGDEVALSMEKTAEWFLEEYQGFTAGKAESSF